jgi:hypothetical protein
MLKKNILFNKWENLIFIYGKLKLDLHLSPCIKINLKWINGLYVRTETLKVLEENTGKTFEDISIGVLF